MLHLHYSCLTYSHELMSKLPALIKQGTFVHIIQGTKRYTTHKLYVDNSMTIRNIAPGQMSELTQNFDLISRR